ncbi:hypothetical protein A2U01_0077852, partial [Trifolium medium]|nr:hypothetical protein [Trifolium medium]
RGDLSHSKVQQKVVGFEVQGSSKGGGICEQKSVSCGLAIECAAVREQCGERFDHLIHLPSNGTSSAACGVVTMVGPVLSLKGDVWVQDQE